MKLLISLLTLLTISLEAFSRGATEYNFEGIVALSGCSGSIIQFEGMNENHLAYVLTNGHCLMGRKLEANEIRYKSRAKVSIRLFSERAVFIGEIFSSELVYATMTDTDIALYRLDLTYKQIFENYGVSPFIVDSNRPYISESIEIISGYWRRGYACYIDDFIPKMKEDVWTFKDALRYSSEGCNTISGTSGSPVVREGTRTLIAINSTGTDGGITCGMNNPCEIHEGQAPVSVPHASYAYQTYTIYSCLDENFDIDLSLRGCSLPKGNNK